MKDRDFSHGQRIRREFRIDGGVDGGGRGLTGAEVAEKGPCRGLQASPVHDGGMMCLKLRGKVEGAYNCWCV